MSDRPTDPAELGRWIRRELRRLDQPARDRKLRAGKAKPRNPGEWEIFASDLLPPKTDAPEDTE